jgi:hypothetical protein
MTDWWSKKLAPVQPASPPRYGIQVQPQAPQPVPNQPVYQQPVQPLHQGERQQVLDPDAPPDAKIPMGQAMKLWRGGEAHRTEGNLVCPDCGSATSFTTYSGRGAAGARVNGMAPRPHCYECGYNGSFSQGMENTWAS